MHLLLMSNTTVRDKTQFIGVGGWGGGHMMRDSLAVAFPVRMRRPSA